MSAELERIRVPRPVGPDGHEWVQAYSVRMRRGREVGIRQHEDRICRRCLRIPLQVMGRGSAFRDCAPVIRRAAPE